MFIILACAACTDDPVPGAVPGVEEFSIKVEADRSRIIAEERTLDEAAVDIRSERAKLDEARKSITRQLATLSKDDRQQRAALQSEQQKLARQERQLESRENDFEQERRKLEREKSALLNRISQMTTDNAASLNSVGQLSTRIKSLDRLSRELSAERQRFDAQNARMEQLLNRVADLVKTMEEQTGSKSRTVIVQKTVSGPGTNSAATSASAIREQSRLVRRKMDSRGILPADLSPAARELERQAKSATKARDFQRAAALYQNLERAVDRTKVNAEFVEAKMRRINGEIGKRKPPARVTGLLNEVSASFTDGRYDKANRKINEIYRLIRGG